MLIVQPFIDADSTAPEVMPGFVLYPFLFSSALVNWGLA